MSRRALLALLAAAALWPAAPARADSLAFIRENNVWLANPDGSGLYQVTLDGTASAPYESPSEADDGTVVAVRQLPGTRRRIYRMTQSGGLLNAPIDTPAPGTGALDAKVSPDGALVAYWFVTTVNDPLCSFCVNLANQVLLSRADRFTRADEVGTPDTGGWPSWLSRDTLTLGSGSPTQWYYRLGMPEAAEWFTDADVTGGLASLLNAEAAPSGDRLAVVHGDNQEEILLLKMTGPPPAKPVVANPACAVVAGPSGRFVDPTWSHDGRLLAWQENDGVWVMPVPADLADCAGFGAPALRIAGANAPDFSPAPVAPGPRPACGNPGNPVCPQPSPSPTPTPTPHTDTGDARHALDALLGRGATTLRRLGLRGLRRHKRVALPFNAPSAGALAVQLRGGTTVLASGRLVYTAPGRRTVAVKLTRRGIRALRHARRLRVTVRAAFTPVGGTATRRSRALTLR
jgi:hypothetical protein